MKYFAENLKKARHLKGWNQSQAAAVMKIPRANLGSYEEGRAQCRLETYVRICQVYKIKDPILFVIGDYYASIDNNADGQSLSYFEQMYANLNPKMKKVVDLVMGME